MKSVFKRLAWYIKVPIQLCLNYSLLCKTTITCTIISHFSRTCQLDPKLIWRRNLKGRGKNQIKSTSWMGTVGPHISGDGLRLFLWIWTGACFFKRQSRGRKWRKGPKMEAPTGQSATHHVAVKAFSIGWIYSVLGKGRNLCSRLLLQPANSVPNQH